MLIFNQRRVRVVLATYIRHYNGRRPHRTHDHRPPQPTHPVATLWAMPAGMQERAARSMAIAVMPPTQCTPFPSTTPANTPTTTASSAR
jgi:hypothetical protein